MVIIVLCEKRSKLHMAFDKHPIQPKNLLVIYFNRLTKKIQVIKGEKKIARIFVLNFTS